MNSQESVNALEKVMNSEKPKMNGVGFKFVPFIPRLDENGDLEYVASDGSGTVLKMTQSPTIEKSINP